MNLLNIITQPFLLGLSSGLFCLSYCVPFVAPYLVSEKRPFKKNIFINSITRPQLIHAPLFQGNGLTIESLAVLFFIGLRQGHGFSVSPSLPHQQEDERGLADDDEGAGK